MYYPFYNNPFYYPIGACMANMCSYGYSPDYKYTRSSINDNTNEISNQTEAENNLFSINGDRLEVFGISINIDDLIILIMLFFMFRETNVDYSIIIILALILFDQS